MNRISYDEMLELATVGAGVMHNRSIEFAKKFSVPVHVRSSFSDSLGTLIASEAEAADQPVCGCALIKDEARITVRGVPDRPGAANRIFSCIGAKSISMDMIVQNVAAEGRADISFTVPRGELASTLRAVEVVVKEIEAEGFTHDENVSKVSIVGLGMATQPGVAQRMFQALAEKGINILMITTSEIKISVLVARDHGVEALRTVHEAFELDVEPDQADSPAGQAAAIHRGNDIAAAVSKLEGMEDLLINDITLDESQARVTLMGVPDKPGRAAQLFEEIAANDIVVDMIVQSTGREGHANLSFTVPGTDLTKSLEVAAGLAQRFGSPPPTSCPKVAKLSVFGIGMRSHTSVASRMFQSLAAEGINIDMINTTEVRVNVVIDGAQGAKGLATLEKEFADVMV